MSSSWICFSKAIFLRIKIPWDENHHFAPTIWENIFSGSLFPSAFSGRKSKSLLRLGKSSRPVPTVSTPWFLSGEANARWDENSEESLGLKVLVLLEQCSFHPGWLFYIEDYNYTYYTTQLYGDLTVSAWAVVEANFNQHDFYTRDKGFVPGFDQSSYRGEVVAILKGLDIMYRGTMYTDCAAALTIFNKLQIAKTEGHGFPLVDHADLWSLVWDHLCGRPNHSVHLVKVKSHQNESIITDPHERWKAAGNNFVDREAKSVVIEHQIYGQVTAAVHRRKQLTTVTVSYHDYICKVADRSFHLLKDKKKCARKEAEQHMECPDFSFLIPRRVHPSSGLVAWEDLQLRCPYGEVFYRRFSEWYGTIRWPVDVAMGVMGYVSLLELYFNFVVYTGTESPISTASRGKPANYKLLDEDILLQTKTWSLSQHTRVWCLFWGWCLKHNVFDHPPVKTSNHFLEHVGYSLQSVCLVGRPQMMHSEATYRAMWDYFHQPEGRRKTTSAPLRPLPKRSLTI